MILRNPVLQEAKGILDEYQDDYARAFATELSTDKTKINTSYGGEKEYRTVAMTISGCTYVNNKSWDDMTPEEREEVRQVFEKERKELEENEDFSEKGFAQFILDKVEEAIEIEN